MKRTAIIILAAGNSSRLGSSKQLLPFRGKTLLQHITGEALASGAGPVFVVVGANAEKISATIQKEPIHIIENKNWENGMASGIFEGIKAATMDGAITQAIITVCDQPFLSASILSKLTTEQERSGKGIIASSYCQTAGTPVLFTAHYFKELLELTGEEGAKKLIRLHPGDIGTIAFPEGEVDIDTRADYEELLNSA